MTKTTTKKRMRTADRYRKLLDSGELTDGVPPADISVVLEFPDGLIELELACNGRSTLPLATAQALAELRNEQEGCGRWFVHDQGSISELRDLKDVLDPMPPGSPGGAVKVVAFKHDTGTHLYLVARRVKGRVEVTEIRVRKEGSLIRDPRVVVDDVPGNQRLRDLICRYMLSLPRKEGFTRPFHCESHEELIARLDLVAAGFREQQ